ncbi:MAG: prepilin-type N-terminal cleavage/methylation domain-containing protein [Thauera aminoaromatica]|uniref:Prepilin-type N-terminal cleavage/methylation domain-containing protein n=2 Tax=Thauera aminoaromatica TaxID=164330 RepID=A0A5C7S547_THASP|nr:MAG: prepilin-type N-terminal cleavage/methylation domain-containing protein [Thauera aminoaromatica]
MPPVGSGFPPVARGSPSLPPDVILGSKEIMQMSKQAGVTLIELLIVVVVVGILTSIAVPAYTDHIVKGKIAQGVSALSESKVRMEQVFNSERAYNCTVKFDPIFEGTPFDIAVSNCSATTFTMTATGKSANGMSGYTYTINQSGEKTSKTPSVSSAQACWLMSKGATSC